MPEFEYVDKNERLKEITDKLEQGIKDLFEGENFKEYLNTMSKFHNYSFNNTMLIALQDPQATQVAGFNTWKNSFGRSVNKGEKGIKILAPASFTVKKELEKIDPITKLSMKDKDGKPILEEVDITIPYFKTVSVFDVRQTSGKELPTIGASELDGNVKDYEKFFEALKTVSPVPIEFEEITDGAKGYYHYVDKRIAINDGMSELQNVKTAVHEISHAKLHDRDLDKASSSVGKDRKTMEIEAEAIAYTVCQHYGLDTSDYSFGYVASWGSSMEMSELKNSLETIRETANNIITKIDEVFIVADKEINQAQAVENSNHENHEKQGKLNIIGNTAYKDISDKKYFKIDNKIAETISAELDVMGVSYSGRVNKATTTFTISAVDVEKFREIEKDVNARKEPRINQTVENSNHENHEKQGKLNIIGNTAYKDIPDKKYFKIDNKIAETISAELDVMGVNYSGRVNKATTTFTISAVDVDKFHEAERAVNAHKEPPIHTVENSNHENHEKQEKPSIIGNTAFKDIADKKYFKINSQTAEAVAKELDNRDIKFSGRTNNEMTTFTISATDVETYKAIVKAVKAQAEEKTQPDEQFVADKFGLNDIEGLFKEKVADVDKTATMMSFDEYAKQQGVGINIDWNDVNWDIEADYESYKQDFIESFETQSLKNEFEYDNTAPSVADLERQVNEGNDISVMSLINAIDRDSKLSDMPMKKPSIRERLKGNTETVKGINEISHTATQIDKEGRELMGGSIGETKAGKRDFHLEDWQTDMLRKELKEQYVYNFSSEVTLEEFKEQVISNNYFKDNNMPIYPFTLRVGDYTVDIDTQEEKLGYLFSTADKHDNFEYLEEIDFDFDINVPDVELEMLRVLDDYIQEKGLSYDKSEIDNTAEKSYKTQPEYEAIFEKSGGIGLLDKQLIHNEDYRLRADENTVYRVLGIDGERALLGRTIEPGLGKDPTPFVIVTNPTVSENGFLSWDSGEYHAELPMDIKLDVYMGNASIARENDELKLFRASNKLNKMCAEEIDTAINKTRQATGNIGAAFYDLNSALAEVTEKFGAERVNVVLATTINSAEWDRRYSDKNKDWAKNIQTPDTDNHSDSCIKTHPAILDGFANYARKAQEQSLTTLDGDVGKGDVKKQAQKRSIREKISATKPQSQSDMQGNKVKTKNNIEL